MTTTEIAARLAERGIKIGEVAPTYVQVEGRECSLYVETRPVYCDRGRWWVKVFPTRGDLVLSFDSQDGFPRYYFGDDAMLSEVEAWMKRRNQL